MGPDDGLTPQEQEALRSLVESRPRPDEEERVLGALRDRGLVGAAKRRRSRGGMIRWTAAAAALVGAFLLGAEWEAHRAGPSEARDGGGKSAAFALAELAERPDIDEYRDEPDRPVRGVSLDPKGMPQ